MKKFLLMLAVAALPMAGFVACNDDDDPPPTPNPTVKVDPGTLSFKAVDEEVKTVAVTITEAASFDPTCEAAWVNIKKTEDGKGFEVTVNEFTEAEGEAAGWKDRSAEIIVTVKNQTGSATDKVTVTQKSPEKPDEPEDDLALEIEGNYNVDIMVDFGEAQVPAEGSPVIEIKRLEDNVVSLELIDFSFKVGDQDDPENQPMTIPVEVPRIEVTGTKGNAKLSFKGTIEIELFEGMDPVDVDIEIDGTVKDGQDPEMDLVLVVDVMDLMTMDVYIEGSRE